MPVLTISMKNSMVETLKPTLDHAFSPITTCSSGPYTFLKLSQNYPNSQFTNILSAIICNQLSQQWLKKILQLNYSYFDLHEQHEIMLFAKSRLSDSSSNQFQEIMNELTEYLKTNDLINLEGFVRFRAKYYWQFLCETVDAAVDAYLIDREYQEFIKLLRYFVELQEPKIEMVNVIIDKPNKFEILDYQGKTIETNYLEGIILEIGHNELDFEDLLISALITIAPARIVLHACPNHHIQQTILSIFGSRVHTCSGCIICKNSSGYRKGK